MKTPRNGGSDGTPTKAKKRYFSAYLHVFKVLNMLQTICIMMSMVVSSSTCLNIAYRQEVNCTIIANVIEYLNEKVNDFKGKNVVAFDTTDALPFAIFSQEIALHYPSITTQILDSLDHNAKPQKIACEINMSNPKIVVVFSNVYKNLVLCEWFNVEGSKTQNLNDMRRFKEAKSYLFELEDNFKIKQVFTKTVQYE